MTLALASMVLLALITATPEAGDRAASSLQPIVRGADVDTLVPVAADSRAPERAVAVAAKTARRRAAEQTDTVVVRVDADRVAEISRALRDRGMSVKRFHPRSGLLVARVPAGERAVDVLSEVASLPGVLYAEPQIEVHATYAPNDPGLGSQWGVASIHAPEAWDITRGEGVLVAVLDTGVQFDHPDLLGRLDSVNDTDIVNADDTANDDTTELSSHGTHVTGIIAAAADNGIGIAGVAHGCTLLPVKVLDSGGAGTTDHVAEGIKYAVDMGADVLNLSLGTLTSSDAIAEAVQYAVSHDCLVIAATGNDGVDELLYPAALPDVVAVGSIDSAELRSTFSNYGEGIDVVAPGSSIYSTKRPSTYGNKNGTSMATPHVAGIAALLRAENPSWTRALVASNLVATARDLGAVGFDPYFGWGLVDAAAALAVDDNIPGVAVPPSPVAGRLNSTLDAHDVYSVSLTAGQAMTATVVASSSAGYRLRVLPPGAVSILSTPAAVATATAPLSYTVTFTAAASGTYYLDVAAMSGSGGYAVAYEISRLDPGDPDGDVPGAPFTSNPVASTLDAGSDRIDVYRFQASAGQRVALSLAGQGDVDFGLLAFAPGVTSASTGTAFAASAPTGPSHELTFTASVTGVHYVGVYAYRGAGSYSIEYSIESEIPGVRLGSSPVSSALPAGEMHRVYRTSLVAGEWLFARLEPQSGGDVHLRMFGPDAVSVVSSATAVDQRSETASGTYVLYCAPSPGTYYLDVHGDGTAASFVLTHGKPVAVSTVSLAAPSTVAYGASAKLTGKVSGSSGPPPKPSLVRVLSRRYGTTVWVDAGYAFTDVGGSYALTTKPAEKTVYRAEFLGSPVYLGAQSAARTVTPKHLVGNPNAPYRASRNRGFAVTGILKPRHTSGTSAVRIYRYRYVSGRWVSRGYVTAKVSNYLSYSRYRASVTLPYAGRWRLRAYAPGDSKHSAAWSSSFDYVTVR